MRPHLWCLNSLLSCLGVQDVFLEKDTVFYCFNELLGDYLFCWVLDFPRPSLIFALCVSFNLVHVPYFGCFCSFLKIVGYCFSQYQLVLTDIQMLRMVLRVSYSFVVAVRFNKSFHCYWLPLISFFECILRDDTTLDTVLYLFNATL